MTRSRIMACLLCLIIPAGHAGAQEGRVSETDRLKKKIESINLIYQGTLLRQYEEYAASLLKDIEDLRQVRAKLDDADAGEIKKIETEIERLTAARAAAVEKANSLRAAAQAEQIEVLPTSGTASVRGGGPEDVPQKHCDCLKGGGGTDAKAHLPAGVIWCGPASNPELSALTLAEHAAPILWFSPNEPLYIENKRLPEALPGDKDRGTPVVYYKISEVVLRQGVSESDFDTPARLRLDLIKGLTLKYYFYYSEDKGFGGHLHDLESVRLDVRFTLTNADGKEASDPTKASHYVAHVSRVIGAAHGVTWYGNQLDIGDREKDTSMPITLLVEEGKHATSPDRNADGFYSPGYDVNRRYTDAWGVRDLIGSGQLGSARYEGSMTKPRRPANIVKVRPNEPEMTACLFKFYTGEYKDDLRKAHEYRLTRADGDIFETEEQRRQRLEREKAPLSRVGKILNREDRLTDWMRGEKFDVTMPKKTHGDSTLLRALRFGHGIERNEEFLDAIPIAYRAEGRQHGFTILPPVGRYREPFLGGYVLPKMNFMFPGTRAGAIPGRKIERPVRFSLEALYTPSASRTFDWYATAGSEWARPGAGLDYEARFVQEGGLRFRFNQGNLLVGGRVGLRVTGFAEARSPRFIFEFGTGAF